MTSRTVFTVILSTALLAAATASAQNRYFSDGANGITLQGGWVTGEDAEGFGGAIALTFNGRFDIGVSYVAPEVDIGSGVTQEWEEITPRLAISLIRPRSQMPVGIDIAASYTSVKFNGTMADLVGGDAQTMGLDIYGRFGSKPVAKIIPVFGIYYRTTEAWYRVQAEDPKKSMNIDGVAIAVEIALVIHEKVFIIPGTSSFDGDTTWSIMGGFALDLK